MPVDTDRPQRGRLSQRGEEECLTCRLNRGDVRAPGGPIYEDHLWVLEHAVEPIPLAGWLVLKPRRHVEAFADLTEGEAAAFGPLTWRIARAMTAVLDPARIYLSMFMEAEGFAHLHVHLIPRFADTPPDRRGPRIFAYMSDAKATGTSQATSEDAERVATEIRRQFAEGRGPGAQCGD